MAHTTKAMLRLTAAALLIGAPVGIGSAGANAAADIVPPQTLGLAAARTAASASAAETAAETPEEVAAYEKAAMARNELLGPYFDRLSALPGFESGGLADESDDLEFYWHGELPAEAEAVIRDAEAHGRTVRIVQIRYSYDQIWQHSLDLVTALEDAGILVGGFGPNRAHDAIELMGPELSVDAQMQAAARAIAASVIPADIDVAFIPQEGGVTFESNPNKSTWLLSARATFEYPGWSLAAPVWPPVPDAG